MKTSITTALFACLFVLQAQAQMPTWYEIPTGVTNKLNAIEFPSANVGYIGGNDSLLLKTTDGGRTWNAIAYTGVTNNWHISNLKFVNETVGFMTINPYMGTYKTIDGGLTWDFVDSLSDNMCYQKGMYFFDEDNGFIAGSGCFQSELIDRMVNGSWSAATLNYMGFDASKTIVDIDFAADGQLGFAASTSGLMFRTTDGGAVWDSIRATQHELTSVAVLHADTIYAGYQDPNGNGFGILWSTDGGLTWAEDINSATFFYPAFLSVHVSGEGKVYSGARPSFGVGGLIFEQGDILGTGWEYAEVAQPINALASYGDSTVFAVGDSGLVLVNIDLTVGTKTIKKPQDMEVSVYPNPAQSEVNISCALPIENVQLLSVTGQVLSDMPLNDKNAFSVQGFATGVYFLRINTATQVIHKQLIINN